jgi:SAM-dependent methyltransferase
VIQTIDNDCRRRTCPFCDSGRIGSLGEIPVPAHIGFSTHEIAPSRKSELWQCADCRSWFKQNALRPEQAVALYSSGESANRWSNENIEQVKCEEVLDALSACAKPSAKALDIGSSTGQLLDFLRARGCDTAGVEYSSACRPILESKGHRYFPSLDRVVGKFDLVTAFDLVEHLYDIPVFFRRCSELLVEGGTLVLLTGDIQSPSARLCRRNWWYLRYPEHVVFPSMHFLRSGTRNFVLRRKVRTYASRGYREHWYGVARRAGPALLRGRYDGLPSLGPDHALVVLGRE